MSSEGFAFEPDLVCHCCRSHDKHKFFDCMQEGKSIGKICADCRIISSIDGQPSCASHIEQRCGSKRHAKCLMSVFLKMDGKPFKKLAMLPDEVKAALLCDLEAKGFVVSHHGFFTEGYKITDLGVSALRDMTIAFQNQWDFAYFLVGLEALRPDWMEILGLTQRREIRQAG